MTSASWREGASYRASECGAASCAASECRRYDERQFRSGERRVTQRAARRMRCSGMGVCGMRAWFAMAVSASGQILARGQVYRPAAAGRVAAGLACANGSGGVWPVVRTDPASSPLPVRGPRARSHNGNGVRGEVRACAALVEVVGGEDQTGHTQQNHV